MLLSAVPGSAQSDSGDRPLRHFSPETQRPGGSLAIGRVSYTPSGLCGRHRLFHIAGRAVVGPLGTKQALSPRVRPLWDCVFPPRFSVAGGSNWRACPARSASLECTRAEPPDQCRGAGSMPAQGGNAAPALIPCAPWPARSPRRSGRVCGSAASTCRGRGPAAWPRSPCQPGPARRGRPCSRA